MKELERELHRKDKALAETAACLFSQKTRSGLQRVRPPDPFRWRRFARETASAAELSGGSSRGPYRIDVRATPCWVSNRPI